MRAVEISSLAGPGALRIVEMPEPTVHPHTGLPGVVIEVHAAGVSFPDLLITKGEYQLRPALPFVPGTEVAGVVRSAPAGCDLRAGDRVAACCRIGGFAEVAVAAPELTFRLPSQLDFAQGAALVLNYHTAYLALRLRGRLSAGETLLVHGAAGGVGVACLQVATGLGARTIAVVSNDAKEAMAWQAGASEVLRSNGPWRERARSLTPAGEGLDVVLDPVGGERLQESLRALRTGGRLIVAGFASGEIPQIKANRLLLSNVEAIGAAWGPYIRARPAAAAEIGAAVRELVAAGSVRPPIGARFPLWQAAAALRCIERRRALGKVILDVRPG